MKVTVLGYLGGYPSNGIGTSSYLVKSEGFHLLLDVGSASLLTLEEHLDPLDLDAVLLSHYHHDHIADLGVLQFTRQLKRRENGSRTSLLPIYGHEEDQEMFAKLTMDLVSEGVAYDRQNKIAIGPFDITHMRTLHPVTCYAFRIEERGTGKVFVFTADSGFKPEFVAFAKNADLLMTDTNFFEGMENHLVHMTSLEAGKLAREANVETLVLTHLPQKGDLELLKQQASKQAPDVKVLLAEKNLELII